MLSKTSADTFKLVLFQSSLRLLPYHLRARKIRLKMSKDGVKKDGGRVTIYSLGSFWLGTTANAVTMGIATKGTYCFFLKCVVIIYSC